MGRALGGVHACAPAVGSPSSRWTGQHWRDSEQAALCVCSYSGNDLYVLNEEHQPWWAKFVNYVEELSAQRHWHYCRLESADRS